MTPPPWRPDLTDPYDLVEEVVRIVGYDQVPSVIPVPPVGRGLTREQRLRRRIGRTLAGARLRRGGQLPVRRRRRPSTRSGCPPTTCCATPSASSNPLSAEEPLYTTTLLPGVLDAAARNLGRGATGVALFETGTVAFPADRGPAPVYGVEWRPTEAELDKLFDAIPEQPLFLAAVLSGERERAGWWGAGRDGRLVGRDRARPRRSAVELGVEVEVGQPSGCRGTPAAAPGLGRRTRSSATPASSTRGSARHTACPRGTAALEIDLDALMAPRGRRTAGAACSRTSRWPRRTSRSSSTTPCPPRRWRQRCAPGAGELLESIRLFDVYTGPQVGEGTKSLAFALRFRAPDRTLTEAETGAARDAAVAAAAAAVGAVQR